MNDKEDGLLLQLIDEFRDSRNEIRDFRNEVQQWRLEMTQRVVTTETQMKSIVGNGQKGRMEKLEDLVAEHKEERDKQEKERLKDRWIVIGGSSVVAVLISAIAFVIKEILK
jgi:hypothetical protein